MKIAGLQKTSLIDYPGKLAAVIYTQGCNLRCPFCHNPELVLPEKYHETLDYDVLFNFLKKRAKQLQGIVVTGGEPLMYKDAPEFLKEIKDLGYLIKLDTNGFYPDVLKRVLDDKLADFVAMDIKAPVDKYDLLTDVECDTDLVNESIELVKKYAPDYEFRTTVVKSLLNKDDLLDIINWVEPAKKYVVQRFRCHSDVLDPSLCHKNTHSDEEYHEKKLYLKKYGFKTDVYFR